MIPAGAFAVPVGSADAASGATDGAATNIFDPTKAPVIRLKITAPLLAQAVQQKNAQTIVSAKAIENKPGVTSFSQVIASSVPGTATAASGDIHVRGSHGQYSYYLDGAPLPSNVSGTFSDLINPKDIETLRVYTGGFPAAYGGQLAAIFDVTAKAGQVGRPGGYVQQLAKGYGTYQSTAQVGGSNKNLSYFISGIKSSTQSDFSPLTQTPIHDSGSESVAFGKFDYQSGGNDRITLDTAATGAHLLVPNTPDRQAVGQNDTQNETGNFANLIWRHTRGDALTRLVIYSHNSRLRYNGSPADLISAPGATAPDTNSIGLVSTNEDQSADYTGVRLDQSTPIFKRHKLQYGFDVDQIKVKESFLLLSVVGETALDVNGNPAPVLDSSGNPVPQIETLSDTGTPQGSDRSVYLQDDWTPGRLHANYGIRYDVHKAEITTSQWSPRLNLDYTAGHADTFRTYYDKLFQPASIEDVRKLVGNSTLGDNSTAAPFQPERDDFFQAGWTHTHGSTSFGLDAYYRAEKNTIDDAALGNTQIRVPFNFSKGYARGIEVTLEGQISKEMSYYANYARSWAKAAGPITGGLVSAGSTPGYIYDDHDQTHSAAFGLAYSKDGTFWTVDGEYGSGLPYGDINQFRVSPHLTIDAGLGGTISRRTQFAFTVNNVFNHAFVVKQASPFSNTEWTLGRQYGIKLTQNF